MIRQSAYKSGPNMKAITAVAASAMRRQTKI